MIRLSKRTLKRSYQIARVCTSRFYKLVTRKGIRLAADTNIIVVIFNREHLKFYLLLCAWFTINVKFSK